MKIEVGDKVELNNGEVYEVDRMVAHDPDHVNALGYGPFVINGMRYHKDGRFGFAACAHPLSVKRIVQKASSDTLTNLNVGPGDVVEYDGTRGGEVKRYIIAGWADDRCYHTGQSIGGTDYLSPHACWRLVRRSLNRDLLHAAADPREKIEFWDSRWEEWPEGPTLWRDMTDAEKGALLLADHKGAAFHVWEPIAEAWRPLDFGEFMFLDDRAYRVAPAATREPIKIQGPSGEILGSGTMLQRDGEWDFDSIAVEDQ